MHYFVTDKQTIIYTELQLVVAVHAKSENKISLIF